MLFCIDFQYLCIQYQIEEAIVFYLEDKTHR